MYSLALTEGPVSVSALVGENALFHCIGSGIFAIWKVDGLSHQNPSIINRGITQHTVSTSSGTVQSTLTVPATLVNNGTTVQCVIYPGEVTSNNATLTVLPGKLLCKRDFHCMLLYRYWSSCQCEVHSIIQCCTVGSSSNCWCTQWSLLYSDCDEQQHWSSGCQ